MCGDQKMGTCKSYRLAFIALPTSYADGCHSTTDAMEDAAGMKIPGAGLVQVVDGKIYEARRLQCAKLREGGDHRRYLHEAAGDSAVKG